NDQARAAEMTSERDQILTSYFGLFNKKDDLSINNFRFHPDYRIDMILWRECIGVITDTYYFKPNVAYQILDGLAVDLSAIYSRAMFKESTPGYDSDLGLEFDLGLHYTSHDNFHFGLFGGLLFPFAGMDNLGSDYQPDIVYSTDNEYYDRFRNDEKKDWTPESFFKDDLAKGTSQYLYDPANARDAESIEAKQDYSATTAFRLQAMFAVTF
ncbi:MAG: hypothetical protein PHQ00_07540, partial [Phycisphaerae bacterium]|nr:hypothetical protein [Phycisphaerae bacterium]